MNQKTKTANPSQGIDGETLDFYIQPTIQVYPEQPQTATGKITAFPCPVGVGGAQ